MKRGDKIWAGVLFLVSLFLLVPAGRATFVGLTSQHPYMMGFIKFAFLASMGEALALRIVSGAWRTTKGLLPKAFMWGVFGMMITLMFTVFNGGVVMAGAAGLLPLGQAGPLQTFLIAFLTSALMNLTFGMAFMAAHRISDYMIDSRIDGRAASFSAAVAGIDWAAFINFVVLKTLPFFWIPAHTLVFLLPGEFRILAAAYLSIALGGILAYAKLRAANAEEFS